MLNKRGIVADAQIFCLTRTYGLKTFETDDAVSTHNLHKYKTTQKHTTVPQRWPGVHTFGLFSACTCSTESSTTRFKNRSNPRSLPWILRPPWMFTVIRLSRNRFSSGWDTLDMLIAKRSTNRDCRGRYDEKYTRNYASGLRGTKAVAQAKSACQ